MASRDDLIEVLSDCIDRLAAGESLDAILRDYPQHASQLAPMLEAGRLLPRARFPLPEVQAAQVAVEPLVRQTVREVFRGGLSRLWWILALVVVAAGISTPAIVSGFSGAPPTATTTVTASPTSTATATASATPTLTATATLTITASATVTAIPTSTASPTRAATTAAPVVIPPSATVSRTTTVPPTPTIERFIVIEGPVTAISGTQVNIYGLDIVFATGSPALTVIQVGDIIRVEGVADVASDAIVVINVTFVNVTVVIIDGQAWRGDSCAVPPPSWAQAAAGDWFRRCTSGGGQGGGSTGGGDNDDDDDDDDDD